MNRSRHGMSLTIKTFEGMNFKTNYITMLLSHTENAKKDQSSIFVFH